MKLTEDIIEQYLSIFAAKGEEGLFRHIVGVGVMHSVKVPNPEIEILNNSDSFFALYRRTGNDKYFEIARILRRAAHKLYRQFLRINTDKEKNGRFLNMVQ